MVAKPFAMDHGIARQETMMEEEDPTDDLTRGLKRRIFPSNPPKAKKKRLEIDYTIIPLKPKLHIAELKKQPGHQKCSVFIGGSDFVCSKYECKVLAVERLKSDMSAKL